MSLFNTLANAVAGPASTAATAAVSANLSPPPAAARTAAPSPSADTTVTLSRQGLAARLGQPVERSGDAAAFVSTSAATAAATFATSFTALLFGDAASGASFSVDAVSATADTRLAPAATLARADAGGPALRLDSAASFIGEGTLSTADGQSYQYTLEVRYRVGDPAAGNDGGDDADSGALAPEQALVGKQLPPVKYPGSLADLFKLLGRELDVAASGKNPEQDGQLSLRLIRLVNMAALLAPRAHPQPTASDALAQYAIPAGGPAAASAGIDASA